jgi:hypothetical protein
MAVQIVEEAGRLKLVKNRLSNLRANGIMAGVGVVFLIVGVFIFLSTLFYGLTAILVGLLFGFFGVQGMVRDLTVGEYSTFDKQADSFSQNDKPIAKISDLKGIQLQHYSRLNPQGQPYFHRYLVYLLMPDGTQTELDNYPDPALAEQIAARIAAYTGLTVEHTEEIKREGTTQPTS